MVDSSSSDDLCANLRVFWKSFACWLAYMFCRPIVKSQNCACKVISTQVLSILIDFQVVTVTVLVPGFQM